MANNIVILGAPGAGKGTQAKRLASEQGLAHISTGDILRAAVKNQTDLGKKAKAFMDAGELVPDDLVIGMVKERLSEDDAGGGFILDGFPRTTTQAVALDTELAQLGQEIEAALLIEIDSEVIVNRLSSRRVCRECGYIGTTSDEICPVCAGEMYQRDDDRADTVRNRLSVYDAQTAPLIDYYKGQGLLRKVAGDQKVDEVFSDIEAVLSL